MNRRSIDRVRSNTRRAAGALALAGALVLAGCASGPREADLLPDEGPTTLEVYENHLSGVPAGGAGGERGKRARAAADPGWSATDAPPFLPVRGSDERVAPAAGADTDTRRGSDALGDLQRDFQQVHNPEILGYVYPHLAGDLPVPGYYTAFPLRDGIRYAEPGEGLYPGVAP